MEQKVEELQPEEIKKGMTITFIVNHTRPGYEGRPFNVLAVCLPYLIVESYGHSAKIDTRRCTPGLPTDEYVAEYTKMHKRELDHAGIVDCSIPETAETVV